MIQETELCVGGRKMRVLSLSDDGFCYGVRRALTRTRETADQEDIRPVFTLGEIVHNPRVVVSLRERGIVAAESVDDIPGNAVVVVRSHGVAPEVMCELQGRGAEVIDATCPRVRRVQSAAEKYRERGVPIVIVGYPDHPEVQGVLGHCGDEVEVVQSQSEAAALPAVCERAVLFQTTFDPERGSRMVRALQGNTGTLEVEETLCNVVSDRRAEVKQLAEAADCLVVVGGKNSSNTSSLVEIGQRAGIATVHVETPDELSPQDLRAAHAIAVVGGTSTPEEDIRATEKKLIQLLWNSTGD